MEVLNEKEIKKLKKRSAAPPIVLMLVSFFGAILITLVAIHMFVFLLIVSKSVDGERHSSKIAGVVEKAIRGSETGDISQTVYSLDFLNDEKYNICIMKDGEIIRSYGDEQPDISKRVTFEAANEYVAYWADSKDIEISEDGDGVSIHLPGIIKSMFDEFGTYDMSVSEMDELIAWVDYWIAEPIEYNGYTVLIKNTIGVTGEEMIGVYGFGIVLFMLFMIPMVLMFINAIHSIKGQRKTRKMYYTDMVTGGGNWAYFKDTAYRTLRKNKNAKRSYAVVDIQVDKYRSYCGLYGVHDGEKLLCDLVKRLNCSINKGELAVRYAKADFALLLAYDDSTITRIGDMLNNAWQYVGSHKITFTTGIYVVQAVEKKRTKKLIDIDNLFSYAAVAKGSAVKKTGNEIILFNDEMLKAQQWERFVEDSMEKALINREFKVYYQPKYSAEPERLAAAEALIRWVSPTEGFITPNRFIPIFENNGFIVKIDDFMLSAVCAQQEEWIRAGKAVVPISVNISRVHFAMENLAEHIRDIVDKYNVPHDKIELELTESAFFDDKEMLLATVNKLKEYGFLISMDDFGSGYSSLNTLKDLPLDVVKLDMDFFRGGSFDTRSKLVVEKAVQLAKSLNMKTVAEGIETKEQVDFLISLDCDLIQGYYYAKPMPTEDFEARAFPETLNK